ncbi:hypothetical protein ACFTSD_02535 [Nocardiaceae bacterium NPDC056970]
MIAMLTNREALAAAESKLGRALRGLDAAVLSETECRDRGDLVTAQVWAASAARIRREVLPGAEAQVEVLRSMCR